MTRPLSRRHLSRRHLIQLAGVAGGAGLATALGAPASAAALAPPAPAAAGTDPSTEPLPPNPREALAVLLAGNKRWASGRLRRPHQSIMRREAVAALQSPFAVVFSCIDSRVPPELVFDRGLGDLFVIRTGGQSVDAVTLGSIELGPEEFNTGLIMVLGHERCGAVAVAIEAIAENGGRAPGCVQAVVDALRPAYDVAVRQPGDLVENTVRAQVTLTVARLKADTLLAERVRTGALLVVGGRYDLDTGRVDVIA
ncbi:carbonic anhydrase [Planosporangium flavigriseum]|uniref:Carbonic anhydrase n=1 Tax=Planosporangium flavigriseum TaxID=373681 RepID=A0A8J3PPN2_9ACTN|nr:carbonic anhydrase [Planosporangium flavigriseum]NJC65870.1 carbonic anhydrase [Planosporangium flavigriseum]GIG76083.1 carbonic anhydrase [Planosporangium flavigriseum]